MAFAPTLKCAFSRQVPAEEKRVHEESMPGECLECERLKKSHSSAVNAYGEAAQRLGRARGPDSKTDRQRLREASEECERTKQELLSHKATCPKN
jgi:hypothetical protein